MGWLVSGVSLVSGWLVWLVCLFLVLSTPPDAGWEACWSSAVCVVVSGEGRMVDALASGADEGRCNLR